jgi:hypothetical protein
MRAVGMDAGSIEAPSPAARLLSGRRGRLRADEDREAGRRTPALIPSI